MPATPVFLGEKPDGISPSRVSQFKQCPRQYQYVSVERLPEKKGVDAYRGTIGHAVLEILYRDEKPEDRTVETAMRIFRSIYREYMTPEIIEELGFDDNRVQTYAAEIVKALRTYFTMEDAPSIDVISTEIRLDLDMGGWGLRGIIDRLDRLPDGRLAIRDYKFGKVPQPRYQAKTFEACQVYAYLVENIYGERPAVMSLIYPKGPKIIERVITDNDIRDAETRVRSVWAAIEAAYEASNFPAQPSVLCGWCAFKQRCDDDNAAASFFF